MGLPNSVIQPLLKVQCTLPYYSIRLLQKLHWFPITECIKYKVAVLPCNNFINGSGPSYTAALLHVYTLSFMFHFSSDSCILNIQQCKCIWLSLLFFLLRTLRLELTGKQTDPGANPLWPTFIWKNYALCRLVIQTPAFILHSTHLLITNTGSNTG